MPINALVILQELILHYYYFSFRGKTRKPYFPFPFAQARNKPNMFLDDIYFALSFM